MKTKGTIRIVGKRQRFLRATVWTVAIMIFYLLSTGPVWWMVKHTSHPVQTMRMIYYPIIVIYDDDPPDILTRYAMWWSPGIS